MRERHAKGDAKSAGGGEKGIFLAPGGFAARSRIVARLASLA